MSHANAFSDEAAGTPERIKAWPLRAFVAIAQSRAALLAAMALVLFYRKPGTFRHPQFWAEDGMLFFRENIEQGAWAIFQPYAGYLLLIPRIVAWLAGRLPSVYAPRIYSLAALAIFLFVLWQLAGPRMPFRFPWACALAAVLMAHSGEVYLNLANVQWITALLPIFLLIAREPATRGAAIVDFTALVLAGLTGPFLVLFAPLFAFRFALYGRSRYNAGLLAAALLVALAHLGFICCFGRGEALPSGDAVRTNVVLEGAFKTIFASSSGVLFFGDYMTLGHPRRLVVVAAAIAAWLLVLSQRDSRRWRLAALLLAVGALVAVAAVYKARTCVPTLWCIAHAPPAGDRYRYLLRLMLLWGLLLVFEGSGWRRLAAAALLGLCVLGASRFFRAQPAPDYHWPQYAVRIDRGEAVDAPIPPTWVIHLAGRDPPATELR